MVDTGIAPYARGAAALFSRTGLTESDISANNGVMNSMPRA